MVVFRGLDGQDKLQHKHLRCLSGAGHWEHNGRLEHLFTRKRETPTINAAYQSRWAGSYFTYCSASPLSTGIHETPCKQQIQTSVCSTVLARFQNSQSYNYKRINISSETASPAMHLPVYSVLSLWLWLRHEPESAKHHWFSGYLTHTIGLLAFLHIPLVSWPSYTYHWFTGYLTHTTGLLAILHIPLVYWPSYTYHWFTGSTDVNNTNPTKY